VVAPPHLQAARILAKVTQWRFYYEGTVMFGQIHIALDEKK